ncbi:MAG: molybdenum cofactor guanylyltransferase [Limnothrix sp.]
MSEPIQNLQVLILAGGKSRRMGRDKALLCLDNQSLLQRTVEIATSISPRVWVVTPWRDEYQFVFSERVQWLDDPKQAGGLVAIAHSFPQLVTSEWILAIACDMPFLNTEQLEIWAQQLTEIPSTYTAALVRRDQRYEPLCGFYRCTVRRSLEKFVANGGRSFQKWLATEQVYELTLEAEKMLFNCNTPTDFATLKAKP